MKNSFNMKDKNYGTSLSLNQNLYYENIIYSSKDLQMNLFLNKFKTYNSNTHQTEVKITKDSYY